MWIEKWRFGTVVLGVSNVGVLILGGVVVSATFPICGRDDTVPYALILFVTAVRIVVMIRTAVSQEATANSIVSSSTDVSGTSVIDAIARHKRRMTYKRWLWWTRFATVMTMLQLFGAAYITYSVIKFISDGETSTNCVLGTVSDGDIWKEKVMISFLIMVCSVALVQCFVGSDVLRWRSFYATQDIIWKAHYQEVFDNGIREALCCMGRVKYLSEMEEDEVNSVAKLLGDLVAYRASGTGHLQLLAGLALLQKHRKSPMSHEASAEAPEEKIEEAAAFHQFAEAAYTGILLDFGRNPFIFPCAWLYRQGILTPWRRNKRPLLEGDNWLRGHAAAYLKYVNLSSHALRRGRVCQTKCEAAYFILVLHHMSSVVIAVLGTETPEDLLTDGLCRECTLSEEDLDGLLNSDHIYPEVKQKVLSTFPHYGHSGIVEAARDLFAQIDPKPDNTSPSHGFLSTLLGAGCECDGYNLRIVGHSLGGAVAALLGIRLYRRYPNLHVYAYGSLPCVDSSVADACSEFVTSIIHDNEFSARLSVGSVVRLRAAALTALPQETNTDTALIVRLARQFLYMNKYPGKLTEEKDKASSNPETILTQGQQGGGEATSHWLGEDMKSADDIEHGDFTDDLINPFHDSPIDDEISSDDPVSQFMEAVPGPENEAPGIPQEIFLPGLIIHLVPESRNFDRHAWKGWRCQEQSGRYKAYVASRECFQDIIVSRSMFLDHLPWRCHNALQNVLGSQRETNPLAESHIDCSTCTTLMQLLASFVWPKKDHSRSPEGTS